MNELEWDALQKKRIAASARRRVTKTSVKLPQYTNAQIKKRSGNVMTYTMGEKHSAKEPRSWNDDMRKKYLQVLAYECGMSAKEMATVLDVSLGGVYAMLKREGVKAQSHSRSGEQKQKYLAMMGLIEEEPKEDAEMIEPPTLIVPDYGEIKYTGSYRDFLQTAIALLGDGRGMITIDWLDESMLKPEYREEKDNG